MTNKERDKKKEEKRDWLLQQLKGHLTSADKRDWFGTITIDVKRGMVDMVKIEETIKPPD